MKPVTFLFEKANDVAAQEGLSFLELALSSYFMSKFTVGCQLFYDSTYVHVYIHTPTNSVSTVFVG